MTNRVLEIIFRLKDEVTKNFNTMAKKFMADSRRMAHQINEISRASLMLGVAITGPMALAFNAAARHSRAVSDELEKVKTVTTAFQLSVATAMIPTVQTLTNALGWLYQAWNGLGPVVQTNIVQIDVFCSFLAPVLRKELDRILENAGHRFEWEDIKRDLKALTDTTITDDNKTISVRSRAEGRRGKVFAAAGAALPAAIKSS